MGISQIESGAWNGLQNLHDLRLIKNKLTVLYAGMFTGLKSLENLHMDFNDISVIDSGVWEDLPKLGSLNLSHNNLTILYSLMFNNLTSLRYLYISDNGISLIESGAWKHLDSLKTLSLGIKEWTALIQADAGVFRDMDSLSTLSLLSSKLDETTFKVLDSHTFTDINDTLKTLDLSNNIIASLYEDMFIHFGLMWSLNFNGNEISSIHPRAFNRLTKLTYLRLTNNLITSIPETTFNGLHSLNSIKLGSNRISFIPVAIFSGLQSLNDLKLQNNSITSISGIVFKGIKLKSLSLGDNPINIASLQSLREINETLQRLWLYGTRIYHIPEGTFQFLGALELLDMRSNNITYLPPKALKGLSSIRDLILSNNNMKTLQRNILDSGDFTSTGGHPGISFPFLQKFVRYVLR